MARKKTLIKLIDSLAPSVQSAFIKSIDNITSETQMRTLIEALERGDINAAIGAINLGSEYFAPLDRALTEAYVKGGDWAIEEIKLLALGQGQRITGFFDGRNPRAEQFLARQSSQLIDELVDDQREMITRVLTQNMRDGVNAQRAALDLVGRVSKSSGRREGGLLGLHSVQSGYVDNAANELSSGDVGQMRNYLRRTLRDKRFDSVVRRAIKDGTTVPRDAARNMVGKYSDRLLRLRGKTIARTELLASMHHAQDEGLAQFIEQDKFREEDVSRVWDASEDSATRDTHADAEGQPRENGFFTVGGYPMAYPGDSTYAPPSETIACRCRVVISIDFLAGLGR